MKEVLFVRGKNGIDENQMSKDHLYAAKILHKLKILSLFLTGIFAIGFGGFLLYFGVGTLHGIPMHFTASQGISNGQAVLASETQGLDQLDRIQFDVPVQLNDTVNLGKGLTVNGDTQLNGNVTIKGKKLDVGLGTITASNVVYGLTAGAGLSTTGGQTPTITNAGVLSFQGQTGAVTLTQGNGMTISGTTISNAGVTSFQGDTGAVTLTAGTNISVSGSTITDTLASNLTTNGIVYANSGSTITALTPGASGYILQSNGTGAAPVWSTALSLGGALTDTTFTNGGGLLYTTSAGLFSQTGTGTTGQCLVGGATPSWSACASGTNGTNYWQVNSNVLSPANVNYDLAIGGTSTSSAFFQVFGATGNATTSGNLTFNSTGNIQTTNNQALILGGNSTGDIQFKPGNSGSSLYLSSTGNVGIGTKTPEKILEVNPQGNVTSTLGLLSTGGAGSELLFGSGNSYGSAAMIGFNQAVSNALQFYTNGGVSRMFIAQAGNIGIGNNYTTPSALLDVNGTASISGQLALYGTPQIQSTTNQTLVLGGNTTGDIQFKPGNSSSSLYLASSGNVGIGTTNPQYALDIHGSGVNFVTNGGSQTGYIFGTILNWYNQIQGGQFRSAVNDASFPAYSFTSDNGAGLFDNGSGSIGLSTNSTERLHIDQYGFVGINNTLTGNDAFVVNQPNSSGDIFSASQSGNTKFVINNSGNVGVGTTTPGTKLDVNGQLTLESSNGNNDAVVNIPNNQGFVIQNNATATFRMLPYNGDIYFENTNSNGNIYFTGNNGNYTTGNAIFLTGNVGIGTGSPTSFGLQIAGSAGPNTTDTYNLGSSSLEWNNLYVKNIISSAQSGLNGFWQLNSGVVTPANITNDFAIGGTATSSALFQVFGNTGNATTAGTLTFTGTGTQIQSINNQTLSFGGISTGDIQFKPGNSSSSLYLASNGNVGIGTTTPGAILEADANTSGTPFLFKNSGSGDLIDLYSGASKTAWVNNNGFFFGGGFESAGNYSYLCVYSCGNTTLQLGGQAFIGNGGYNNNPSVLATLDLRSTNGTEPTASISGASSFAGLVVDNSGTGDLFTASSSGLSRFVVTQNGNVGVGTTTPISQLQVDANTSVWNSESSKNGFMITSGDTLSSNSELYMGADNTNTVGYIQSVGNGTYQALALQARGGNVGIGGITPRALLDVGTALTSTLTKVGFHVGVNSLGNATAIIDNTGGSGDIFTASSAGSPKFVIDKNGNVGIGTTNPTTHLFITNGNSSTATTDQLALGSGSSGYLRLGTDNSDNSYIAANATMIGSSNTWNYVSTGAYGGAASRIQMNGNISFQVASGGTNPLTWNGGMTIANNGNVGIGNATPLAKLDVAGSASISGNLSFTGAPSNLIALNGQPLNFNTSVGGGAGTTAMTIANNGNIGVGTTTPNNPLEVRSTTTPQLRVAYNGSNYGTVGVDSSGNVTIDTGSGSTLSVGNTNASTVNIGNNVSTTNIAGGNINLKGNAAVASGDSFTVSGGAAAITGPSNSTTTLRVDNHSGTGAVLQVQDSDTSVFTVSHVSGTIANGLSLSGATTGNAISLAATGSDTNIGFKIDTKGTGNLLLQSSSIGNVGIGTTTPQSLLSIAGNAEFGSGDNGTPSVETIRGAAASGSNIAGANLTLDASNGTGTGGSGDLIFRTAGVNGSVVTHDADSTAFSSSSVTSLTWSHTTGSYGNRILVVTIATVSTVSNVTYDGQTLTKLTAIDTAGVGADEEMWYLLNPPVGTYSIVVTQPSAIISAGASTYYNVNQSTPFGTAATTSGSSTTPSISLAANNSQLVVDGVNTSSNDTFTAGSGQTQNWNVIYLASSRKSGGLLSSTTMSWTISPSDNWQIIAAPLNPVVNTSADSLIDRLHITAAGNVGIGTATPLATLDLRNLTTNGTVPIASLSGSTSFAAMVLDQSGTGDLFTASTSGLTRERIDNKGNLSIYGASLCVKSNNLACAGSAAGTIYASNQTVQAGDIAENYISSQTLEPGDLVIPANDGNNLAVVKTTGSYQQQLIGVVSTNPGVTLNSDAKTDSTHKNLYPIALNGRVPVKVSTENGPISVGDFLTSSSVPGIAMKATKEGTIIGKALDNFDGSTGNTGKILVYVSVSWANPTIYLTADGNLSVNGQPVDTSSLPITSNTLVASGSISSQTAQNATPLVSPEQYTSLAQSVFQLQSQIATWSAQIRKIDNLSQQLTELEKTVNLTQALQGISTMSATTGFSPLNSQDSTIGGNLSVLGKTLLGDVGITGEVTQGLLTINGMDMTSGTASATINTLSSPLKIQSLAAAGVDFFNGKVTIDTNGNITTSGDITVRTINADKINLKDSGENPSVGEATIPVGLSKVIVKTAAVTDRSKIFVTLKSLIDVTLVVTDQKNGVSFTVALMKPVTQAVSFNWWIAN